MLINFVTDCISNINFCAIDEEGRVDWSTVTNLLINALLLLCKRKYRYAEIVRKKIYIESKSY